MKTRSDIRKSLIAVMLMVAPLLFVPLRFGDVEALSASPVKWIRYANNPILSAGPSGDWDDDSSLLYMGCVIQDGNGYKMYYEGYSGSNYQIGLAISSDGTSWTKSASNPIIGLGAAGSWESSQTGGPYVIKDDSTYKMWYHGGDGSHDKLGYATSSDGENWTKYSSNPILTVGAAGAFDSVHVAFPCVIKENDTSYLMWFTGYDSTNSKVGYATSSDGINWTKYANNPVLNLGAANSWDDYHIASPKVINISNEYRMWYSGDSGANWGIGYATSSDGTSWTKYSHNPVLAATGNGWEAHDSFMPSVIYNGSGYQMWYTGVSASWVQKIGYAEGWNTAPDAPTLSSPADNTWTSNDKPKFSWTFSDTNSQDKQTAYQVQVDDKNDYSSVDYESGKVSSAVSSCTPASALSDGTYYWRARVWDSDDDSGPWSSTRTIKIDTTPPTNPSSLSSTSHTVGQWSTDNTIDISFSGASDSGSGLDGYSYTWDYATGTLPDDIRDIDSTVSTRTSPPMSDSKTIYFHIRAIDVAGNPASDAAHFGPFWVDATPPLNPLVTSDTHTINNWSNVTTVNVSWSGADASISGLNGYSVAWDTDSSTLPDTVKEYGAQDTCSTSPGLTDGIWYFHIRTKDEAGNWATAAAHFGPLLIDSSAPFNPLTLSSDHVIGQWSNDDTVKVQWRDFNGSLSGVGGFSYSWDSSPDTVPDEINDCDKDVTATISAPLSDGTSYYFHIRTHDNAGNWNQTASHIGPFWIDTTPPANPIALTSSSHKIRSWSNETTIHVNWSIADEGGLISGYEGYSFVWDIGPTTLPDTTIDVDANVTSTTSPPMPDSDSIYFHIRARDRAGNWAADAAHLGPFWIDSTPPKNPSVVESPSHQPENWSAGNIVEMNWSAADGGICGVDGYSFLWSHSPDTLPPETVNVTAGILGSTSQPLADGNNWYFHIRTKDLAGNWAPGAMHRGPYYIDTTPPVILSLSINSGAPYSTSPAVRLSVTASDMAPGSGLYQRRQCIDGGEWSLWEDYTESWNLNLTGNDGQRTIQVQVRDRVENPSPVANATILLDTRMPSGIEIKIDAGVNWTNSTIAELTIRAGDAEPGSGLSEMALSRDGASFDPWEPFLTLRKYNLTPGDGTKTVYLKVRDRAGNVGSTARDDILLDTVNPGSLVLTIAGGAPYTTNATVTLRLQAIDPEPASGVGEMAFSEDGSVWTEWQPYSTTGTFTFDPGDGMRGLYFRVRDRALNIAGPASDTILLDTTSPSIGLVQVSGISQTLAVVTWYTDEPSNGLVEYGSTTSYGSNVSDASYSTQHILMLGGLAASTDYHLRVSGWDVHGNGPSYGPDLAFRTLKREDQKAPVVTNVRVEDTTDRTALVLWDTDEPADSAVDFGTTKELGQLAVNSSTVQSHSLLLKGLSPASLYYFKARSTDPAGNGPGSSGLLSFTTLSKPDTTPPRIFSVTVTGITDSLAIVSWTTDERADGRVDFGPGGDYVRSVSSDRFELSHVVVLAGLLPGKEYHFRAGSTDLSGNGPSYSTDMVFSTSLVRDTASPVIEQTHVISAGSDNVTIEVVLNEPGTVLVDFGKTTKYGKNAASPEFRMIHQIRIFGLEAGSAYHYRISATDATGNGPSQSVDMTFRTKNSLTAPPGFGLTVENTPYIFLIIIVVAAFSSVLLFRLSRRANAQDDETPAKKSTPMANPVPVASQGMPVQQMQTRQADEPAEVVRMREPEKLRVVESVSAEDFDDEDSPGATPTAEPTASLPAGGGRPPEGEILKVLSSLPRGLPSSLWSMELEELAAVVSTAEHRQTADGEVILKIGSKWYYGDPKEIGTYLQLYKGR